MNTKRHFLNVLFLLAGQFLFGQRILNGGFEDNSAGTTKYNLSNEEWTGYVHNCYGFGTGVELDIQGTDSQWGKAAVGKWWVSLASPSDRPDGFTMKLSSPLIKGQSYELSWMEMAGQCGSNGLDDLHLGVSDDPMSFGTEFYVSHPKMEKQYQKKSVKFIAPQSGLYISVQNGGANNGWNFVDEFKLNTSDEVISIAYTPLSTYYLVSFEKGIDEVIITDADGKQLFQKEYSGEKNVEIDVSKFTGEGYILQIKYGTKVTSAELVVNTGQSQQ